MYVSWHKIFAKYYPLKAKQSLSNLYNLHVATNAVRDSAINSCTQRRTIKIDTGTLGSNIAKALKQNYTWDSRSSIHDTVTVATLITASMLYTRHIWSRA